MCLLSFFPIKNATKVLIFVFPSFLPWVFPLYVTPPKPPTFFILLKKVFLCHVKFPSPSLLPLCLFIFFFHLNNHRHDKFFLFSFSLRLNLRNYRTFPPFSFPQLCFSDIRVTFSHLFFLESWSFFPEPTQSKRCFHISLPTTFFFLGPLATKT